MSKAIKLLIFDLDGTLIDSVMDLCHATQMTLSTLNLPTVSLDQVRSWVGNGSVKLIQRALKYHQIEDDQKTELAHRIFLEQYAICSGQYTQAYDGVDLGLRKLKESGFCLALVTNKPAQFLPDILDKMAWESLFDLVLGGDSLPNKKPHPEPLLHTCTTLKIPTSQSIMIGDSKNDILAGKAAGMATLAVSYGYNYAEPISHSQPDMVFDEFCQLTNHLLKTDNNVNKDRQ